MDIFDEISQLNTLAYNEGLKEGEEAGQKQAQLEGFRIGKKMSFNISKEIGYYYGAMQAFKINTKEENKHVKLVEQISNLIEEFNYADCHSDQFETKLNHIRDKYKQFCSLTGTKSYAEQVMITPNASKFSF
jgi:hypothetical protein